MSYDMKDPNLYPEIARVTEGFKTNQQNKEMIIGRFKTAVLNKAVHIVDNANLIKELGSFNTVEKKDNMGNTKTTYEGVGEHDDMAMATFISFEAANSVLGVPSFNWIGH